MARFTGLAMVALALATAAPLLAEESPLLGRSAVQFDGAIAWAEGGALPLVGMRFSRFASRRVGLELGVTTPPQAIAWGLVLMPDVDAVVAVPMGSGTAFLARGGVSAVAGMRGGEAGAFPGVNVGAGLLMKASRSTAVRLDYTWRAFPGVSFSTATLGVALLRR